MAGTIFNWSTTATNNDTSDGDINWAEGQSPDTVNNSARVMMARQKEFLNDITGVNVTGGTASALTLSASSKFTTLIDGLITGFNAHVTANASATLNVNGLGGKSLRYASPTGDIAISAKNVIQDNSYIAVYSTKAAGGSGGWVVMNSFGDIPGGSTVAGDLSVTGALALTGNMTVSGQITGGGMFPSGTKLLFPLTSTAPTGWVKDTTHNDKALRIVSGTASTGGTVAFSTAFASRSVTGSINSVSATGTIGSTTLTTAQIPSHAHSYSGTTGSENTSHSHYFSGTFYTNTAGAHAHYVTAPTVGTGGGNAVNAYWSARTADIYGSASAVTSTAGDHSHYVSVAGSTNTESANHQHAYSGTTNSSGSDGSHTHGFTPTAHSHTFTGNAIDLGVSYVDSIICTKS